MIQIPAPLAPKQRLVFAMESALIVLMFKVLTVVLFAMDLRARPAKRLQAKHHQHKYQTSQVRG